MPIIFKEAKKVVEYIKSFLLLVAVYWAAVGLDMVFISLVCTDERTGSGGLLYGINKAIEAVVMTYTSIFELIPTSTSFSKAPLIFETNSFSDKPSLL